MKIKYFIVLSVVLTLNACSEVRDSAGVTRKSIDEFQVVEKPPLIIPPDFSLIAPDQLQQKNIDEVEINKISLSKVFFSYDNKKNVLKNISFDIDKNSSIGICGKSGSGKTTFIDIVSGLISPTSGIIKINNGKTTYKNEHLIYNSSYCSQKTILIEDTIENNIALASVNEKIDKNKYTKH